MNYSTNPNTRTYPRNPYRGLQEEIWELKGAIVEKNDKIKELQKERDEYKESIKLERIEHNTERKATTQFQNDKIKELKSKLVDREKQFDELDGVLDRTRELLHAAMDRIQEQNDATCSIGERDAVIKELEGKLADSERRFNELDTVLVRTFALLHVVNGCLRKRDKTINELESELHR